jgi:SRSO17 transposase
MLNDIVKQQQIPFRYVLADSVYANSPEFVEAVEFLVGVTYFLQVPEDTLCWLKNPCTIKKEYKY